MNMKSVSFTMRSDFMTKILCSKSIFIVLISILSFCNSFAQPSNYGFTGSTTTYTPITGTAVTFTSQDDASTGNLPIGFAFNYNGANSTVLAASTNGLLIMGQTTNSTGLSANGLASNANIIAGLWDDNNMTGGTVQYLTSGTAPSQTFTVQYTGMHVGGGGSATAPTIDMQIILYETSNRVQIIYGPTSATLGTSSASIGISGASGNFLSVTPTSPSAPFATVSNVTETTTINSAVNFPSGTRYTFLPPPPCVTPGDQPTALVLTPINSGQINGTFTAASTTPDGYLVVRYPLGGTPTAPVDGVAYANGATLGTGTVVQSSSATTFSATGLTVLTTYDFYVYSRNAACTGGPLYLALGPLTGSATTTNFLPPSCPTTYVPAGAAVNVPITQVLSWSGALGNPAITGYNVYFGTNGALVNAQDPSTLVISNLNVTSYTPPFPGLAYGTTYFLKAVPINTIGAATGCATSTFTTYVASSKTANVAGGLWSSTATWVGGAIPVAGDNVVIPDGATVTVDQAVTGINSITIGGGVSGVLNWSSVSNAMTLFGNITINPGGRFLPYTTGSSGQTINIGGSINNMGYANLALSSTLINFNGSQQAGGSLSQALTGAGTYQGDGSFGLVRSLFHQSTGTTTISTTQNIKTTNGQAVTAGTLNTNGKLTVDNTAQVYGTALNTQISSVAPTSMGSGYTSQPIVFGASASGWTAGGSGAVLTRYFAGNNVYLCTLAGTFDPTNAPTHTSGSALNGTADLLWLGTIGTIGNPFSTSAPTVGSQIFYGDNLYTCTVAGTPSAAAPPTHLSGTAVSGSATFLYAGTAAKIAPNWDVATSTVRSYTIVNPGLGYSSSTAPTFTVNGGGGTSAAGATVVLQSVGGTTINTMQKSGVAVLAGGLTINNTQGASSQSGVGNIFTTNGGVNYTVAPTVGFAGPTALNLVTASGSGFTTVPTLTLSGGTLISGTALTTSNFTITANQGKLVSVYLNVGTTATYSVPPTLTVTGGGGTGATVAFPAGCWPAATATIGSNGQLTNFTVTNAGFGYVAAPTVGVGTTSGTTAGGTFTTVATAPTARVALYNLTLNFFTPAPANAPHADDVFVPVNRKLNALSVTNSTVNFTNNIEVFGSTTPLTTSGTAAAPAVVNMGGNNLLFTWNAYAGQAGSLTGNVTNGSITLTTRGGGTTGSTLNYPFDATYTTFTGSGTSAVNGASVTTLTVSRTAAPTGTGSPIGTRAYNAVVSAGAVYGTNPTVTLNWNANDNLISDNPLLRVSQSAALAGPWVVRSLSSGTGALPATGSRTTATATVGPIVPTGNDFFGWTSTFIPPPPLNYVVTRTTSNVYTSIAPIASGGDGTGTLSTAAGDEGAQTGINIAAVGFVYQGSPVTAMAIHSNGYISLNNAFYTYTTASSWDNTLGAVNTGFAGTPDVNKRNVIAPFYDDLNKATPVIYYKISGTKVTAEWFNTTFFGLTGPQLFYQVVLDAADQSITFNYGNMQLYNGTQNIRYSYTSGINGSFVQAIPQPGQIMQQQYENTTYFTHENALTSNWGANGLAISPEPRSSIKFTPGAYVPVSAPVATAPANDEPAGAITRPALPGFPSNIAWDNGTNTSNLFTTRYATNTASPANCGGSSTAKDVWFKFVAPNPSLTVRIYGSGGFIPRVSVYDAALAPLPNCVVGTQGLIANTEATGLTVGNTYFVRVYHENTGTQATATATIAGGVVTGLTITPGTNYSNPATAFSGYSPQNQGPKITFTGGGGTGAAAGWVTPTTPTAVLPLTAANIGFVGGSGYTTAPTVTIDSPDFGITGEFGIVLFSLPPNDECSGAIALTGLTTPGCNTGTNSITNNTQGATASPDAVVCNLPDDDLWYKFTATSTTTSISLKGTGAFDGVFQLYDAGVFPGSCGTKTSLSCTNAAGAGAEEAINATTIVGNTYFVRVYHALTGSVAGEDFTICVSAAPPQCVTVPTAPANASSSCVAAGNTTLSWPAVTFASQYDVYFDPGTSDPTTIVSPNQTGLSYTTMTPLTAGTYAWKIVPKNANGPATSCGFFTFTVVANPTINITPTGPVDLCAPATQLLSLGMTSAATPVYQWVKNGVDISGEITSTYLSSTTGSYSLRVTDGATTCSGISNAVIVNVTDFTVAVDPASVTTVMCQPATLNSVLTGVGSPSLVISEVTLFRTGTGATATYPSYIGAADQDFVEISNITASPINIGGYTLGDFPSNVATAGHPFTFPVGFTIPANSVAVVHLGAGTDDVPNRYLNTGGTVDSYFSGGLVGIVLKNGAAVIDAVGVNSGYIWAAGTGVTAGDWAGFAPSLGGFAGSIRTAALDANNGTDWSQSNTPTPLQTIGTYNGSYTPASVVFSWLPTTGLFRDLALTIPYTGQSDPVVYANPASTTTYTLNVTYQGCPKNATTSVTIGGCNAMLTTTSFMEGYMNATNTAMVPVLMNSMVVGATASQCDTIVVQLRDATTYGIAFADTVVMSTAGVSISTFPAAALGNMYYIAVQHRNALETWSKVPQSITAATTYDFTTSATQAYGDNMKALGAGSTAPYAFYSGDINGEGDGVIDNIDYPIWETDFFGSAEGYFNSDFNGDGVTDNIDYPFWESNFFNSVEVMKP
jgi:hypothetical protein